MTLPLGERRILIAEFIVNISNPICQGLNALQLFSHSFFHGRFIACSFYKVKMIIGKVL